MEMVDREAEGSDSLEVRTSISNTPSALGIHLSLSIMHLEPLIYFPLSI